MDFPLIDIGLKGKTRFMPQGWFARSNICPGKGVPVGIVSIPRSAKRFSLAATCKLPFHRTQPHPGKQDSAHAERICKKNTQRLTGVRMRHRGTVVQRNRNEWSMEGPHPGVRTSTPTAIHAHCLLLFCSFFGPEMPDLSSVLSCRPCCFHLLFALRPTSSPVFSRNSKKTASSARQDGICN